VRINRLKPLCPLAVRTAPLHDSHFIVVPIGPTSTSILLFVRARALRVPDWQHTTPRERLVQKELRRTLQKYKLRTDQELFDKGKSTALEEDWPTATNVGA
jgi:hypothetical protein